MRKKTASKMKYEGQYIKVSNVQRAINSLSENDFGIKVSEIIYFIYFYMVISVHLPKIIMD